jgi:hypothetical protein
MLTITKNRVDAVQAFLERNEDFNVTGDETWVSHHTPENKRQSVQWHYTHPPTAKKFKTSPSNQKIMATFFWDRKGPLLFNFLP